MFLNTVIANKIIDGRLWRFNSAEKPWRLESFQAGQRTDYPIIGDVAETVARHFGMNEETLRVSFDRCGG